MALFSYFAFPAVLLTATLLSSCSRADSSRETKSAPKEGIANASAIQFSFGGKVDSLNGIAGHTFGEPLSAFPQMRLLPPSPGEVTRTYVYQGKAGWFGQHHAQVPTQFYYFLDGKFCRFLAIGNAAVLRPETIFLFGPSQQENKYRLFWEGSRARAAYIETPDGFGWKGTLNVLSKPFEAELAAQAKARLQAENAQ
jgi:hypothetical protein